jgi:LemA protein
MHVLMKPWKQLGGWVGLWIVLFSVSVLALSGCGYNQLQTYDEEVKAAWSEVQNQYQRRSDLVPNLVQVVKGEAKFEKDTLTAVIEARAKATQIKLDASQLSDKQAFEAFHAAQNRLSSTLSRLLVTAEQYPTLKSNQGFRDLQVQIEGTENRVAVARKRYIDSVAEYNKGVRHFPTNLTAKMLLGLQVRETYTATEGAATAPKVDFQ